MLNRMWKLVNDRLNYLTPTIKPIGYASSADGRRRRLYDAPQTPLDRPLAARVLSAAQQADLITYRDSLNPAQIGRKIADLQNRLLILAKEKTEQLYLANIPTALPDIHKGIEPPRHVRRLQFLERMGSCQVVHRGGTRRSCVSGRCGWSQRSAVSTIRSGQRSVRSPVYLVLAARRRCVSGCARRRSMPAHGPGPRPKNPLS